MAHWSGGCFSSNHTNTKQSGRPGLSETSMSLSYQTPTLDERLIILCSRVLQLWRVITRQAFIHWLNSKTLMLQSNPQGRRTYQVGCQMKWHCCSGETSFLCCQTMLHLFSQSLPCFNHQYIRHQWSHRDKQGLKARRTVVQHLIRTPRVCMGFLPGVLVSSQSKRHSCGCTR